MQGQSRPGRKRPRVTGLRMNRDLIRAAKYRALDENTTLTKVIERAIEIYLKTKVGS